MAKHNFYAYRRKRVQEKIYYVYIFILLHLFACYVSMFVIFSYICSNLFELYNHKSFAFPYFSLERKEIKERNDKEKRFLLTFLIECVQLQLRVYC